MSAVLHIEVALARSNWTYTPSSLLTQMSSLNMAILRRGATLLSHWKGATLIRVNSATNANECKTIG